MNKAKKIAVVGPVYPYRSGIAQYTEALADSLAKKTDVYLVSFKNLYPKKLYPGKSDKVAPLEESKKSGVDYILDSSSPASWRRAAKSIEDKKCDVAIITWWTFFWQPALGYVARRLRKKGIKVIYLCHNIADHEENWVKKQIGKKMINIADGYIVHSYEEASRLKKLSPDAKILRRAHPVYTHFPKPKGKLKKRGRLELLYFGLIRPYKGVDVLINAMSKLDDSKVYLTIVGEVWGKKNQEQLTEQIKKSKNPNIEYSFKYTSEEETAEYFDRADVIVMPYLSATGSGVVGLAYNYGKPVLASAVGGLPDVVTDEKTGWLISPKAPVELARTIQKIERSKTKSMGKDIKNYCRENSWDNMATEVYKFLSSLNTI